jgi:hypothetical protein
MDRETQMHPFDAVRVGSFRGHSSPVGALTSRRRLVRV